MRVVLPVRAVDLVCAEEIDFRDSTEPPTVPWVVGCCVIPASGRLLPPGLKSCLSETDPRPFKEVDKVERDSNHSELGPSLAKDMA